MLMKELRGNALVAIDGRIGSLDDLYIDEESWTVRYLVVDTGAWLAGRRVLLPPRLVAPARLGADAIAFALTREEMHNSAEVAPDRPSQRSYWEGHVPLNASAAQYPAPFGGGHPDAWAEHKAARAKDAARKWHVRAASELLGYSVVGHDGACGRIEDVVVDERHWSIPGVVVQTGKPLAGKKVLVGPGSIEDIDSEERVVHVALTHEQIARLPAGD